MPTPEFKSQVNSQSIARLFLDMDDVVVEDLRGGGSNRDYFRISATGKAETWILCLYDDERPENKKFVKLTNELADLKVKVPKVMHHDEQLSWYVMEDLGRINLWDITENIEENRDIVMEHYRQALESVARLHAVDENAVPAGLVEIMENVFDGELYRWEQTYFFKHFAGDHLGMSSSDVAAIAEHPILAEMADGLDAVHPRCLVHRDFQSQNIIPAADGMAMIDYQGVRLGLGEYDVASLLYDPYTSLSTEEIEMLLNHYYRYIGVERDGRRQIFFGCTVQRLMQALGAYGNLGHNLGKSRYLSFIEPAITRLQSVIKGTPLDEVFAPVFRIHAENASKK